MEQEKKTGQKTTEEKAAAAILQKAKTVTIDGQDYEVAPPSTATLILVSEAVSKLPAQKFDGGKNGEKMLEATLAYAKACKPIGEIAALLILGAKRSHPYRPGRPVRYKKYLFGLIKRQIKPKGRAPLIDPVADLSDTILETMTPREIMELIMSLITDMQVADFFALTTFLCEINLLRETKVDN